MEIELFNKLLNESGIKMPHNTYAAKIIHHQDFDGVFSAIITFRQLVKQGIPEERIKTLGIQYGRTNDEYNKMLQRSPGQMVALVDFARLPKDSLTPDFWSDHHTADRAYGSTSGRIGASEFKSESSHLALVHTINMITSETVEVINKIDSAGYTDLEEVLKLPKDFKESRRLERLGILCNALLTKSGLLKNNSLLELFIKETQPSILSFYNNIFKYLMLDDVQHDAIKEISRKNPDWDMIERSRAVMPNMDSKVKIQPGGMDESAIDDYEEYQLLKGKNRNKEEEERYRELINQPLDLARKSRADSIEKEKGPESGFIRRGSTLIQNTSRLQRYIWTQLNDAGLKYPFVIKRFPTFIQVAVNPELPNNIKDKIDLGKVANDVMKKIRDKFETKYNSWAFKIIDSEKGGHKGITNIPALGTLGLMNKKNREELKYLKSLKQRVNNFKLNDRMSEDDKEKLAQAKEILDDDSTSDIDKEKYKNLVKYLKSNMRILMPTKFKRMVELKAKRDKEAKKRTEIMDEIIEEFINQFEKQFGASKDIPVMGKDIKIKGGKEEYAFESMINKFRNELGA